MKNIVYVMLFISFGVFAQKGSLKGKVAFEGKGKELVDVYLKKIKLGSITNEKGIYNIKNIPLGEHVIYVSYVGFKTIKTKVTITEGENTVDFQLKDDLVGLDQVVITATRSKLNRKNAPVIVTVTDKLKLEAVHATTLSEGLSFSPGLRFESNCQNCGYSQVRMNGMEGAYTQILVDSRPIFSSLAGIYGLDQIPANTIERVEVVRGGGSALYGSNAIAGTINIITKDPTSNSFQVGGTLGLINGKQTDASLAVNGSVVSEDFDSGMTFFGSYRRRNAYDHDEDTFSEIPKLRSKSFGAKGFLKTDERSRLTAEFTALKEFRRGGDKLHLLPFQTGITEQIDSDVFLTALTYETANEAKTDRFSVYATGSLSENENYYGGAEDDINNLSYGTSRDIIGVLGGQYIHSFDKDVFTGGLEYKYDKTNDIKKASSININQEMKVMGAYGQYEWNPVTELKVLGGFRLDYHNLLKDEKVVLSPRVNILYKSSEELGFRVAYAKGFRAPQFFTDDLHVEIAGGGIQNVVLADNLVSETSHSFTASVDWSKNYEDGSQIGVTLEPFYTLLNNPFILEETEVTKVSEKRNGDKATVMGVNLEFKYAPNEQFIFQAGATVQQGKYNEDVALGEDEETGKEVVSNKFLRSPSVYGNFVATYAPTKKMQHNLSAVVTGDMYVDHTSGSRAPKVGEGDEDIDLHTLVKTDSFFELNWKSSYNFDLDAHKHVQLQVNGGVQNIFNSYQADLDTRRGDRDAAYIYGPSRPRTFFIGFKIGNL